MAIITIFGGSNTKPGEDSYEKARWLGSALAQDGHIVMTGGYIGSMEAASRGASEAEGHVIGVTCEQIEAWRAVSANPWVKEIIHCQTLFERLEKMITLCEAAFVLPGGPGTLTEVSLMWNLMVIEAIPSKPIILIGSGWKKVFDTFFKTFIDFIPLNQQKLLIFSSDEKHACLELKKHLLKKV